MPITDSVFFFQLIFTCPDRLAAELFKAKLNLLNAHKLNERQQNKNIRRKDR